VKMPLTAYDKHRAPKAAFEAAHPCSTPFTIHHSRFTLFLPLAFAAALSGCGRNDIQVYRVAKEPAPAQNSAPAPMPPHGDEPADSGLPSLRWKLPAGWEEVPPGEMRVASFRVAGKNGASADVSVVPLPGMAGSDLANVNRWRSQVGQPPVTEENLTKLAEPVQIAGQAGQLFEQAGLAAGSGETNRILAAVLRRQNIAWFFKMTGDDALVAQQKSTFIEFLKTLEFQAAPAASEPVQFANAPHPVSTNLKRTPHENSEKPVWVTPPGWQEVPAGQMLVAKFVIGGTAGSKAELNISNLGGTGGGLLANLNRWRNQLGLAPVADSDLQKQLQPLDVSGGKAMLTDMSGTDMKTGQKARLVGAIVPLADQTWFYKLMGDEQVVEKEKETFVKFVQTIKYPR
jgi:hypothetical protein